MRDNNVLFSSKFVSQFVVAENAFSLFIANSLRTTREMGNAENLARFCHLTNREIDSIERFSSRHEGITGWVR